MWSTTRYFTNEEFEKIISYKKDEKTGEVRSEFIDKSKYGQLSSVAFNKQSIFDDKTRGTVDRDAKLVEDVMRDPAGALASGKITPLDDRAMGALVGMAVADAMGHRFEFEPAVYGKVVLRDMGTGPGGAFRLEPGQWTDDASMGLCLADSLLVHGGELDCHDLMHRFIAWWSCGYNNAFRYDKHGRSSVGLGGNISMSFGEYIWNPVEHTQAGDKNTSGNGSVMRNAPVAVCFHGDMAKGLAVAAEQSTVTHQGTEAAECCRLLTYITIRLLGGEGIHAVLDSIGNAFIPKEAGEKKEEEEEEEEGTENPEDKKPKIEEGDGEGEKKVEEVGKEVGNEQKSETEEENNEDEANSTLIGVEYNEGNENATSVGVEKNDTDEKEADVTPADGEKKEGPESKENPEVKKEEKNENSMPMDVEEDENEANGTAVGVDEFYTDVESVRALALGAIEKDAQGRELPDRDWRWKEPAYRYCESRRRMNPGYIGSYAMDAMAMALHVLYTTESFEEAVVKVVNMRGDSDSVGSVVAQMAGAAYGLSKIPKEWVDVLAAWDNHEIALRGYMLAHLFDEGPSRSSLN